jgi:pyruvate,water dikinase
MNRLILWPQRISTEGDSIRRLIGGKAAGLVTLRRFSRSVPAWCVLTTECFRSVLRREPDLHVLIHELGSDPLQKAARLRQLLEHVTLRDDELMVLRRAWRRLSAGGKRPIAVRSSAADEDSRAHSFAGQMDSSLNVWTFEQCVTTVKHCWASAFGERAVQYRQQNGIDPWRVRVAVVLQRLVDADVSGVVFTANPVNGRRGEMLISSTYGLGEGLVSGRLDADTFIIDPSGRLLRQELVQKRQRVVRAEGGGTALVPVAAALQAAPSLSAKELRVLARIGRRTERTMAAPADIEFAVSRGKMHLLQARPITTLGSGGRDGIRVWDNSNIVESYAGVTTPMTFSFIRRAYAAVYWQFCETIGVDRKSILAHRPVFENMLGLLQGRVYYNLLNWYRLVSLMPGFSYNRRFMEQMMGLQEIPDYAVVEEPAGFFRKHLVQLPRLCWVGLKMLVAHFRLPGQIRRFHAHFQDTYERYLRMDFARLTPPQLLEIYRRLELDVLWKWRAPITNDFEAMIFYGLLKHLTVSWKVDPNGTLHNDLLCGDGSIHSTEVTTQLLVLARMIEQEPILKEAFANTPPEQALERLRTDARFETVGESFEQYLKDYGMRCVEEMKLETVTIRDNPVFCVAMMQNYLRHGVPDVSTQLAREQKVRRNAEVALARALGRQPILGFLKLLVYRRILSRARRAVRNRENQRFARTQVYGLVRMLLRSIGAQWQQRGLIDRVEDIFYLEIDEVWTYIEGAATCVNLKELIALRRREFEGYLSASPDDHIETTGEVYVSNTLTQAPKEVAHVRLLKGLGCCAGVVEQTVRVVLRPDSGLQLSGEILVAKQTDPGWIVLFPSISGLIVEKGSMLSHSAIVAREMGIPAVVGVKDATRILRDGDRVVLDGAAGTVTVVSERCAS